MTKDEAYKNLVCAVLMQAVRDIQSKEERTRKGAIRDIECGGADLYLDFVFPGMSRNEFIKRCGECNEICSDSKKSDG